MSAPQIDPAELTEVLAELVRTPSPNPPGDEEAVAMRIAALLAAEGIDCQLDELAPGRPNLHTLLGPPSELALVLNGHSDTMPAGNGWSSDPYEPIVEGGRMTGLGACDMKAGLAAMVVVFRALARAGTPLRRAVRLDIVADEEATGAGSLRAVACQPLPSAAVIVEPTQLELVVVGNGQINVAYELAGRAAHASAPELGANAVAAAARALAAIESWAASRATPAHALIGAESASIGTVAGGFRTSVVPDRCRFSVDLRVSPGRDPDAAAAEVDSIVASAIAGLAGISWSRSVEIRVPPFETDPAAPVGVALANAHRAVTGAEVTVTGMRATTDAAAYAAAGVDTVIYGAGALTDAHRPDEHVRLADVATLAEVLLGLTLELALPE